MSRRLDNISDLFEHELKDIYDAENKLAGALRQQAAETTDPKLRAAFHAHEAETKGQIARLEKVFAVFGKEPDRGEGCAGIDGLLEEHKGFKQHNPSPAILDTFNISAAKKVERYEITAYEGLVELAMKLDLDDVVEYLSANLQEEEATLDKLEGLADEVEPSTSAKPKATPRRTA